MRSTSGGYSRPETSSKSDVIIALAAELFDKEGYHRTSMETLAAHAGIAKPTLYHYFDGKESILFEIHQQFIQLLLIKQEERAKLDLAPSEQLLGVMGDILGLMATHRGHVRVFFEHHRELTGVRRDQVLEQRSRYQAGVEQIISEAVQAGEFRDADPRLTALAIFGMCNWSYQWYREGQISTEDVARFQWELVLRGLHP